MSGATRSTERPLRQRAELRRRQRLGHRARRQRARPDHRHDHVRLGEPDRARLDLPDRADEGAAGRPHLHAVRGRRDRQAERPRVHHVRAAAPPAPRTHRSTAGRTSPRPTTAPRCGPTSTAPRSRAAPLTGTLRTSTGVTADRRQRHLGGVVRAADRRGPPLQPRAHGRRDPGRHDARGSVATRRR